MAAPEQSPTMEHAAGEGHTGGAPAGPPQPEPRKQSSRLMLSRMELDNFKSYYGPKTIGPFHKRFSSVVGPNGSGKSNTIDALLFVFGKKSSRLRAKKLAELIHSSDQHPNVEKATVTIHFQLICDHEDSEEAFDVVQGSEFSIARSVTRKASYYYMDGKKCTRDAVEKRLLNFDVDLNNNRFLILQGEVESISLMKPKAEKGKEDGFLEYLEDIIGSHTFKEPLRLKEEEGVKMTEDVQLKLNRVKMVEKERDTLREARDEALGCIRTEIERDVLLAHCQQVKQCKAARGAEQGKARFGQLAQELEAERHRTEGLRVELDALLKNTGSKQALKLKIQRVLEEKKRAYTDCEARDAALKEEKKNLKKMVKQHLKKLQEVDEELQQAKQRREECVEQIPMSERLVTSLTRTLDKEEKHLDKFRAEVEKKLAPLKEKKDALEKSLIPLRDVVNEKQQAMQLTQDEIGAISDRKAKASERAHEAQQKLDAIKSHSLAASRKEHERLAAERTHTVEGAEKCKNVQTLCAEEIKKYQQKKEKVIALREEIETDLQKHRGSRGGRVAKFLAELQKQGIIKGFHGRLGSLGGIDAKYDVAASSKGGGKLGYFIMEEKREAVKALRMLKQKNVGRAKFLSLDVYSGKARAFLKRPQDLPKGATRLLDLVKCEKLYRVAFAGVFRHTLVAKNGKEAHQLAFGGPKRWPVVTLSGQLIDTSGTMTGGGKPKRGLMGQAKLEPPKYTTEDLDVVVKKYMKYKDNIVGLDREMRKQAKEGDRISSRVEAIDHSIQRQADNISRQIERQKNLERTLPALQAAANGKEDKPELDRLTAQIGPQRRALDDAQRDCSQLERDIMGLQMEMMAQGGKKLQTLEEQVQGYRDQRKEHETMINGMTAEKSTLKKRVAKLEKKHAATKKALEGASADHKRCKTAVGALEAQAMRCMKEMHEVENEFKMARKSGGDEEVEVSKKQEEYNRLAKRRIELEDEHRTLQARIGHEHERAKQAGLELAAKQATIQRREEELYQIAPDLRPEEKEEPSPMEEDGAELRPELRAGGLTVEALDRPGARLKHTPYRPLSESQLKQIDDSWVNDKKVQIAGKVEALAKMEVNMNAVDQFKVKNAEYNEKWKDLELAKRVRNKNRSEYEHMRKGRLEKFMGGFTIITERLKEMYRMLTFGGDAELELVDSVDPFSEGVQFSVRPPKKSWKVISNLSGGEKTLASMALVFALHHYKPTPLYCMDEIDAALDFKNVSIVANYIKERTKNAQFIIISLRNNMFELANRLVGIYKTNNQSKSLSIDPQRFITRFDEKLKLDEEAAAAAARAGGALQPPVRWVMDAASVAPESVAGEPAGAPAEPTAQDLSKAKRELSPNTKQGPLPAKKRHRTSAARGLTEISGNEI